MTRDYAILVIILDSFSNAWAFSLLFFLVENQMQEEATTSNKSFILDKDISIHNAHLYYIYFKILNIVTDLLDF